MAIERIFFREDNFVLTVIYGRLTNAEIGEHVIQMNREYAACSALVELADCRYLHDISALSSDGLMISAGMEKGQLRTAGSKGAIVVANDVVFGLARVYAAIAAQSRIDSRVYRDLDEAVDWLGMGHLKQAIHTEAEARNV
ncbi:hypothetical protein FEF65_07225 [Mariprofundus erugo]|uniref:STAS/SEC14 domain-containing protein n=1 Tax=Mariprofundus erugo TaxID=2528639 RepID=A0A5R9GVR6_9PROT|nr:hypothetical protein [Mariprofundus erugo]TLS67224.1 hypothetical protein FEF65_07225 [Mariprofundus erugo]